MAKRITVCAVSFVLSLIVGFLLYAGITLEKMQDWEIGLFTCLGCSLFAIGVANLHKLLGEGWTRIVLGIFCFSCLTGFLWKLGFFFSGQSGPVVWIYSFGVAFFIVVALSGIRKLRGGKKILYIF